LSARTAVFEECPRPSRSASFSTGTWRSRNAGTER
jgi:hypothetical protein